MFFYFNNICFDITTLLKPFIESTFDFSTRRGQGLTKRKEACCAAPGGEGLVHQSRGDPEKIRVFDLPAFVADKTMAYYEEEFDVS